MVNVTVEWPGLTCHYGTPLQTADHTIAETNKKANCLKAFLVNTTNIQLFYISPLVFLHRMLIVITQPRKVTLINSEVHGSIFTAFLKADIFNFCGQLLKP